MGTFSDEINSAEPCPLIHQDKLESALMRPLFAVQYVPERADIIHQATVLAIGISQAQAFEQGNKRAAFMACRLFLRENGRRFVGNPLEMAQQLIAVAERTDTLETAEVHFEAWLREKVIVTQFRRSPVSGQPG